MSTLSKPASFYSHLVCAISNLRRRTRSLRTHSPTEVRTYLISFQQTTCVWNLSSAMFSSPFVYSLSLILSLSLSLSLAHSLTFIFYAKMYMIKSNKTQISLITKYNFIKYIKDISLGWRSLLNSFSHSNKSLYIFDMKYNK